LYDTGYLQVRAYDQEDDTAESQGVDIGCQAIATAVGDDIFAEQVEH